MVIIQRISTFRSKIICDVPSEMNFVKRKLSFFQETAIYSALYQDGIWDGFYRFYDKNFEIDHGLWKYLLQECEKEGIKLKTSGYNTVGYSLDLKEEDLTPLLWQHQKEMAVKFFKYPFGIGEIPTRGGKTFSAAEISRIAIKNFNSKILFIVDTVDLHKQTVKEFELFFKMKRGEIGSIQGKIVDYDKQIVVATIQTLTSIFFPKKTRDYQQKKVNAKKKNELLCYLKSLDLLIVDEIHEFLSDKRIEIIKTADNVKGFLSLSATPYKSESFEDTLKLKGYTGDTIFKVEEKTLQERGVLSVDEVFLVLFNQYRTEMIENRSMAESEYASTFEDLIMRDPERNDLLVWMLDVLEKIGLKTLALFTRKEHGKLISEITGHRFLSGDDKSNDRIDIKDEFLGTKGGVLLASNIFKKGVSLNSCEVLININSGLEQADIVQKRGRVLASSEGKTKSLIIDILDNNSYFKKHSLSRIEAYEKTSSERIFAFDYGDESFKEDFVKAVKKCFNA